MDVGRQYLALLLLVHVCYALYSIYEAMYKVAYVANV